MRKIGDLDRVVRGSRRAGDLPPGGELADMFARDAERSYYTRPARHLAAIYLNGVAVPDGVTEPLPAHVQQLLGAAARFQEIADRFAGIFPNPAAMHDFLLDPPPAAAYVESVAAAHR